MANETMFRKNALMDWTNELEYQEKILKNENITPEQRKRSKSVLPNVKAGSPGLKT